MVKVIQPLGGIEAHGSIGRSVIYQGQTAKVWKAPVIKAKAQAQQDAQDLFQSVTKIVNTAGLWVRGYMQAAYGNDWYSLIFGAASAQYDYCLAAFSAWESFYQESWRSFSPYQDTKIDKGLAFYLVAYTVAQLAVAMGYDIFELSYPQMDTAGAVREVWDKTLDGVFGAGLYDDNNPSFDFSTGSIAWTEVTEAQAYGGKYRRSVGDAPAFVAFYFYGTRIALIYHESVDYSVATVEIDSTVQAFSQNNAQMRYQMEWTSPIFSRGLHRCYVIRTGANGSISVDGLIVYA